MLVETGVCNGVSTAMILEALDRNGSGRLWSIDYPEYSDGSVDDFSATKLGAVVPSGKQPGWVIPEHLRERWELIIGKSQDELPPLLDRLQTIDFFMHDSEHSYECMTFEMESAADDLRSGGLLVVDDSRWNNAFEQFVERRRLPRYNLGGGAEATVMPPARSTPHQD
jgi:predicted O-methyltransferase YrrM